MGAISAPVRTGGTVDFDQKWGAQTKCGALNTQE
jgi:hypothetical protein